MKSPFLFAVAALLAAGSFSLLPAQTPHEKRYDAATAPLGDETPGASLYRKECSACHMAYQPALLPKRSWQKVMHGLASHFGTDATLEPEDDRTVTGYLLANAADVRRGRKHMARIAASLSPDAPMQVTRSAYFVKEHRKIAKRYIAQPEVGSLANCNACHTRAETGSYREREIRIPRFGRWDD